MIGGSQQQQDSRGFEPHVRGSVAKVWLRGWREVGAPEMAEQLKGGADFVGFGIESGLQVGQGRFANAVEIVISQTDKAQPIREGQSADTRLEQWRRGSPFERIEKRQAKRGHGDR
ncbi:hypothetical protein WJ36_22245 [Burkholderia ubonensis]|nr:hypothetical protein WJ36_22245 [Burkholderia ubonensis]